ncbi:MAG: TolC family protein [Muribaculaceae bacterium]|nr:TolC family protein [Muribaculaceae bacterium]
MWFRILLGVALMIIVSTPCISKGATIDETAIKILKGSPAFQSDIYSLESAYRNLKTESNLPDPELGGEYLVMPSDVDNRWTAELTWSVEWPGVYGARGKEADKKFSKAGYEIHLRRMDALMEIRDLLLDYIQHKQKLDLLEELNNNNDSIYRLARESSKGGEITILDLNKVRLEYANIRSARASLLDEELEITSSLSKIYGKDCSELLKELILDFPEIVIPSDEIFSDIKNNAPSLKLAQAEAEAAEQAIRVAKMEALPSLSIGYKHAFEDGMHFNGATFGISLPIFSSRGRQKAAKADIIDAQYRIEAGREEIDADVAMTIRRLQYIKNQIDELEPIMVSVDYNTQLLKAYRGGLLTLIEYISDRNYFTTAAMDLITMKYNAAKALMQLEKYRGLETL